MTLVLLVSSAFVVAAAGLVGVDLEGLGFIALLVAVVRTGADLDLARELAFQDGDGFAALGA